MAEMTFFLCEFHQKTWAPEGAVFTFQYMGCGECTSVKPATRYRSGVALDALGWRKLDWRKR